MNFLEYAESWANLNVDAYFDTIASDLEKSEKATELQKQQWDSGKDANGNILGIYKPLTQILSGGKKQAGTPYNLLDTGDFRAKTFLFMIEKENDLILNLESEGKNRNLLIDKLGDRIFGLQKQNKEILTDTMQDIANSNLKKLLKI